jgi:molybdopterin-biosynthesis enzyme MoeA-like protein
VTDHQLIGVVVVGDELLSGKRRDRHLAHVIDTVARRGMQVAWCRYVGDEFGRLTETLCQTRLDSIPVFCFGGIGATPDDQTRQAAANAFGTRLVPHPDAVAMIEQQFGEQAYPTRIRMAELPERCQLIPNPCNRIPGFTVNRHHFFPGFPEMAWPMLDWVLNSCYAERYEPVAEYSVQVRDVTESSLCDLMDTLVERHPRVKLFSLPRLEPERCVELGFRGAASAAQDAFNDLREQLAARGLANEVVSRR